MASGTCPESITQCAQRSFASGRVNSHLCSYDLMCQSQGLSPAIAFRSLGSPCSLDHPLLVFGTFPTLLPRTFSWMLGPLPRLSQWCLYPFLPTALRPSRNGYAVGSLANTRTTTSVRTVLSWAAVISLCSGLQVCLPPGSFLPSSLARRGSCDFYFRAPCVSLPSCTSDMLAVRIGQLTAGDLHPIRFATLSAASNRFNGFILQNPHGQRAKAAME